MDFQQKLKNIVTKNNSLLCIGLDPELNKGKSLLKFNKSIIDQTSNLVCAYKPNIAFYESLGIEGLKDLKKTFDYLKKKHSDMPVILDAKRADIGNTSKMYAKAVFEYWGADAVTVYPHLGLDSVEPFLKYKDKLTIVLIKTSNPDAKTLQNLNVGGEPYYFKIAKEVKKWNASNLGVFVGATYPKDLKIIRQLFPDTIILTAGLGVQGGKVKATVRSGINKNSAGIIFNASRSIIYSDNPKQAAQKLRDEINEYR